MNKTVSSFLKNIFIFLIGSFGSKFLSFVLLPVYTSILSKGEFGQFDLVTTTQGLLFPMVTIGLSEAIFRFVMNEKFDKKNVMSIGTIASVVTYMITVCLSFIVNIFLKWEYMQWMNLLLACTIVYGLFSNYLKANKDTRKFVAVGVLYTFLNLTCNILFLVVIPMGVEGLIISMIIANAVPSILIFFVEKLYKQIRVEFLDKALAKRMIKYSLPLIFTSLSWWIVTSSDRYMIRYFLSEDEVGVYGVATRIPLILQTLISIFQTVWQISTNQIHDEEPTELKKNFILFTRAFRQVGFISGSGLLLITQFLMFLVARNEFYAGWIYAPFLILSIVFSFATGMVASLYGAFEKNSGALYSVLVGGVVNIILNALFIPRIGVMGATISTAISRLIIAIYRLKDTERLLSFDREYSKVAINCILITSQCCCLVYMKDFVYPVQVAFFFVICLYNRKLFSDGATFLKSIRSKKHEKAEEQ